LEKADLFNLLCIPPYKSDGNVDTSLVGSAAQYCEKRRAMLLVDPPSGWINKDMVRRHDILKDELEKAEYDLVHCRLLLVNLPSPEKALKHMSEAVRPGGWLLVEENDYGPMMAADADDPSASAFAAACKASNDFVRKKGIAGPLFGREVRGLVEGLGYEDVCMRARKTGSDEGYGLLEGTEAEVNESLVKYSPYVSFEATPVVSMPQLAEAAKKRAVSIKK
jgi:SAM-dependent methyltransferase